MGNIEGLFFNSSATPFFLLWILGWKAVALWKAATKRQLIWFLVLLVVNSLGLLEIAYIFWLGRWPIDKKEKVLGFLNEKIGQKVKTA